TEAEAGRVIDSLSIEGIMYRQTQALISPWRLGIPLVRELDSKHRGVPSIDQLEVTVPLHLLGHRAFCRSKVCLPALQHRQSGGHFRHVLDDQPLDIGDLAPVAFEGLEYQFHTGGMADEFERSQTNGVLFEAIITDLLHVFLGDHETCSGRRAAIEGHKIRPGGVQLEAYRALVHDFNAPHLRPLFLSARTLVAWKAEAHVFRCTGLAVMKFQPWT